MKHELYEFNNMNYAKSNMFSLPIQSSTSVGDLPVLERISSRIQSSRSTLKAFLANPSAWLKHLNITPFSIDTNSYIFDGYKASIDPQVIAAVKQHDQEQFFNLMRDAHLLPDSYYELVATEADGEKGLIAVNVVLVYDYVAAATTAFAWAVIYAASVRVDIGRSTSIDPAYNSTLQIAYELGGQDFAKSYDDYIFKTYNRMVREKVERLLPKFKSSTNNLSLD